MDSKIRIKLGQVELEYEGPEKFLRDDLPSLLEAVLDLHKQQGTPATVPPAGEGTTGESAGSNGAGAGVVGTTGTLAARLSAKSSSDLALAAAARITLVLKRQSFSRADLLAEMKSATNFYKTSFSGNFTQTLKSLIGNDKLREVATGVYALSASELSSLETRLAG